MFSPNLALSQPAWPIACGDGRVDTILDDFDSTSGTIFKADAAIPDPVLRQVVGCHGTAMAVDYDLTNVAPNGQSWIVLRRSLPTAEDLSGFTHIRLAIQGSNINGHDNVEVKLRDEAGNLSAISLQSMTDLPVWRPIYIDLRELTGSARLTNITGFEIGIVRCAGCEVFDNPGQPPPPEMHMGTLFLDEFSAVSLNPGMANRWVETSFESVTPDPTVLTTAANALFAWITLSGPGMSLVPAWFPEANPNFNSYAQAEALLVFIYEFERTGNVAYRDAARNLAAKLISLQIPSGQAQAGAWYSAYTINQVTLRPPDRALPPGQSVQCDGNEAMVTDPGTGQLVATNIDTCEWAGNVGWLLIALGELQRSGFFDKPTALRDALERGAAWVARQSQERGNLAYPNLITLGIEGNISAFFGLLRADKKQEAALLGNAIFQFGWDSVQQRMKPGVGLVDAATALDVSGSWGGTFLRTIGKIQEALESQGYAASVLRGTSFDGAIFGYGDIAGPYTVSVEFTAQAASAGIYGADFVMQQIDPLQISSGIYAGAFPGATDHWYGGQLSPWSTTMPGVSPTAWVYFANNRDPLLQPVLTVTKTHAGNFTQGQSGATYAVTVSNQTGVGSTSGTVTLTETLPTGLTLASMAGMGWACPAGGTTCTRSDVLNDGASYPPITVTVNVAANATSPQVNVVGVSGGGSASANTTDTTIINAPTNFLGSQPRI